MEKGWNLNFGKMLIMKENSNNHTSITCILIDMSNNWNWRHVVKNERERERERDVILLSEIWYYCFILGGVKRDSNDHSPDWFWPM